MLKESPMLPSIRQRARTIVLSAALTSAFLGLASCAHHAPPPPAAAAPVETKVTAESKIKAAMAGGHRFPKEVARDKYRHPLETLTFFGLRDDMTVIELSPGGGWF